MSIVKYNIRGNYLVELIFNLTFLFNFLENVNTLITFDIHYSWGGCVVAMVSSTSADDFVKLVKDQFYAKRVTDGKPIDKLIFTTNPSEGACMYVTPSDKFGETFELPVLVHL